MTDIDWTPRNLLPGQYQIEDLIFGKGTVYKCNNFEIMPYGVQAGDFQIPDMDENKFAKDQHTPGPINITLGLIQNRWLRKIVNGAVLKSADVGRLQRIWRGDGVRKQWGEQQALFFCGNDYVQKVIYGRTGKFQYPRYSEKTESFECTLEFRRTDSFAYSATEYVAAFDINTPAPVMASAGTLGDAPSWVTIYLRGPMQGAEITFGSVVFQLDWDIPAGKILEINSYPWSRRCVDSDGINRRANLVGPTPYLDRLRFNYDQPLLIRCTANGTTSESKGVVAYRDAFQIIG